MRRATVVLNAHKDLGQIARTPAISILDSPLELSVSCQS